MSTQRSNSSVRNLRAVFEGIDPNAERPSSTTSDRTSLGDGEKVSKIRASFVSVERPDFFRSSSRGRAITSMSEPTDTMKEMEEDGVAEVGVAESHIADGATNGTDASSGAAADAVTDIVDSQTVPAAAPSTNGNGIEHPEPETSSPVDVSTESQEPMNRDKPITGAEEEPGALKPAEPALTDTIESVSTPKSAKKETAPEPKSADIHKSTPSKSPEQSKAATKGPHTRLSLSFRQSKSGNSPATNGKSPYSPRRPTTSDSKSSEMSVGTPTRSTFGKSSRSSLTAQTAASAARAKSAVTEALGSAGPAKERRGPKSPTRPVRLSAHLTAPTASFAAKHENTKPAPKTTSMPKPSTSQVSRTSMSTTRTSNVSKSAPEKSAAAAKKPATKTVHADEGFLARMTRPTASSANRAQGHDKAEPKPVSKPSSSTRPHVSAASKTKAPLRKDKPAKPAASVNGTKAGPSTPTTNGKTGEDSTLLDSSMAAIATPGLAEATIR